MTDDEADELLQNNDWAKWSDARKLLQEAAHMGAMAERERCARIVEAVQGFEGVREVAARIRSGRA